MASAAELSFSLWGNYEDAMETAMTRDLHIIKGNPEQVLFKCDDGRSGSLTALSLCLDGCEPGSYGNNDYCKGGYGDPDRDERSQKYFGRLAKSRPATIRHHGHGAGYSRKSDRAGEALRYLAKALEEKKAKAAEYRDPIEALAVVAEALEL
ncbi:MAG: hypothetical protein Q9213_002122 [Squamulea squamosa]